MTIEEAKNAYLEACQRAKLVHDAVRRAAQAQRNREYAAIGSSFPGQVPEGKELECWKIEQHYDIAMGKAAAAKLAYEKPYYELLGQVVCGEQPEPIDEPEQQLPLWDLPMI